MLFIWIRLFIYVKKTFCFKIFYPYHNKIENLKFWVESSAFNVDIFNKKMSMEQLNLVFIYEYFKMPMLTTSPTLMNGSFWCITFLTVDISILYYSGIRTSGPVYRSKYQGIVKTSSLSQRVCIKIIGF